jgi:hypothetical protein
MIVKALRGVPGPRIGIATAAAVVAMLSSPAAFAQCTGPITGAGAALFGPQFSAIAASGGAAAGSFAGALGNLSTAFLTQQGSAFVSAPGDPNPISPAAGFGCAASAARSPTSFRRPIAAL